MRCENCKDTLCPFRLTVGECRNYPNCATLEHGPYGKDYQPADTMKKKAMLCKWYSAGECKKGLPGTKCELSGCVAWEENKVSVYDLGLGGIGVMEEQYKKLADAAKSLVETVEGYITPKKNDKYVFRNEVLAKCNELKKLLNETE